MSSTTSEQRAQVTVCPWYKQFQYSYVQVLETRGLTGLGEHVHNKLYLNLALHTSQGLSKKYSLFSDQTFALGDRLNVCLNNTVKRTSKR